MRGVLLRERVPDAQEDGDERGDQGGQRASHVFQKKSSGVD